jgi:uncharacterized membrane protein
MRMNTERSLSKTRIEALGDGVFAIAMTLLILEVKVSPELSGKGRSRKTRPMMLGRDAQHSTKVALILTVNGTSMA